MRTLCGLDPAAAVTEGDDTENWLHLHRLAAAQGRKVVFIFSKARSANSITSKLFEHNEHFIHFHEPFSAWRTRHANERSLHTDVDFLERLVECKLSSEEVYNVVTQVRVRCD